MIYFIEEGGGTYVKIGYSTNPKKRLPDLQPGNPRELSIIRIVPGGKDLERALHAMFSSTRRVGEWFLITAAIAPILDGGPAGDKLLDEARALGKQKKGRRHQTAFILTRDERETLRLISSNGTIVGGVRALIAYWNAQGRPALPAPAAAEGARDDM